MAAWRGVGDGSTAPDGSNELDFKLVAMAHDHLPLLGPVFGVQSQPLVSQYTKPESAMNDDQRLRNHENRPWVRSRPVKAMFCPPEYADLETIAEGWGVPVSTAMLWAIVVGELARWRRQAPEYGKNGIAIASAITVLRLKSLEDGSDTTAVDTLEED
ncbi:MAG: hypothetical protein IH881_11635 [Myxococcales bacterium]|nr:hypothetical protein [Myxococcales bacterium]